MHLYFAKILMRLVNFGKLQSIDQRLPLWRARVKSTWNFTVRLYFYTWKFWIFHLENLQFSLEKSRLPWSYRRLEHQSFHCVLYILVRLITFSVVSRKSMTITDANILILSIQLYTYKEFWRLKYMLVIAA